MSTNTALDQIKNRVEGHTEGPWRVWAEAPRKDGLSIETSWARPGEETELVADCYKAPDVELIAAAPKLLAALEAVQAMAGKLKREGQSARMEDDFNKGIDAGFTIAAKAIESAIEEALR